MPPSELPPATRFFTGREEELSRLVQPRTDGPGAALVVVDGMAGVGKTTLVVRAAHDLTGQGRYPDGTLFVDLLGFSERAPTRPAAALHTLLRRLGVPGPKIPPELDARVALFRTVVARRRLLIVLDNARDEGQVRPLLPGTGTSLVLVTSRHRLAGLDDADHISLPTLPMPEAVRLFRSVVGPRRDPGDEQIIEQIVRLCGLLPLAVRIAAARLQTSRTLDGPYLLAQLRDAQDRLTVLDDGDRSLRSPFTVSFRHLPADERRAFATLGLHPGIEFEPYATAALLGTAPANALRLLDNLERANLLEHRSPGRYQFHDLIRAYAGTAHPGTQADPQAALDRLYGYYAATTVTAMHRAYPFEAAQRPRSPIPAEPAGRAASAGPADSAGAASPAGSGSPVPDLADPAAAQAWLDVELDNLLAAARHAADQGRPAHTVEQSATLHRHLRTRGHYVDAHALHHRALDLAHAAGELTALTGLGQICRLQGRYDPATSHLEAAIRLARDIGDPVGQAEALNALGQVHYARAAHGPAADCFGQAVELAGQGGNRTGELDALNGLGRVHLLQGRNVLAADCFGKALRLAEATGNGPGEVDALGGLSYVNYVLGRDDPAEAGFARVLELARAAGNRTGELNGFTGLGHVHLHQGRHAAAADDYVQVLDLARATGDRTGELNGLTGLGHVHLGQGDHAAAADCYRQVLDLAGTIGDHNQQFNALLGLGRTHLAADDPERARHALQSAVELASRLGQRPDEVRALYGLAQADQALGHPGQARHLWQRALAVLTDLGEATTEDITAADIQRSLTELDETLEPPPPA